MEKEKKVNLLHKDRIWRIVKNYIYIIVSLFLLIIILLIFSIYLNWSNLCILKRFTASCIS